MRVHCCAAFYVLIFMPFYGFSTAEKALIFLTIGSVISAEAFNTAIESAVDLVTSEKRPLAKLAKDAAAGAVLITAAAAAAVGIAMFWDTEIIGEIFTRLAEHIGAAVLLAASVGVWIFLIALPSGREKLTDNGLSDKISNINKEK
jgi:diacylglycerol kinase